MHGLDLLIPTVSLLGTGFIVIFICRLLHISPIIGFLLAGVGLGPHGLNVIAESETTQMLAELGVAFLLFDIGLHFSVNPLKPSSVICLVWPPYSLESAVYFWVLSCQPCLEPAPTLLC